MQHLLHVFGLYRYVCVHLFFSISEVILFKNSLTVLSVDNLNCEGTVWLFYIFDLCKKKKSMKTVVFENELRNFIEILILVFFLLFVFYSHFIFSVGKDMKKTRKNIKQEKKIFIHSLFSPFFIS